MRRLALLLCVLCLFGMLSACATDSTAQKVESTTPVTPAADVSSKAETQRVEPLSPVEPAIAVTPSDPPQQVEPPKAADTNDASSVVADAPSLPTEDDSSSHHEGDVDSSILEQIGALEQSSSVRNDDVAPVESSAYCKFSVSCEALLERKTELADLLLPPDGVFYSGTIVLHGGETALALMADTLAACGLICELDGQCIVQIAAIPEDLQPDMGWTIRCNGEILDDPANTIITSGDVLAVSYEVK